MTNFRSSEPRWGFLALLGDLEKAPDVFTQPRPRAVSGQRRLCSTVAGDSLSPATSSLTVRSYDCLAAIPPSAYIATYDEPGTRAAQPQPGRTPSICILGKASLGELPSLVQHRVQAPASALGARVVGYACNWRGIAIVVHVVA